MQDRSQKKATLTLFACLKKKHLPKLPKFLLLGILEKAELVKFNNNEFYCVTEKKFNFHEKKILKSNIFENYTVVQFTKENVLAVLPTKDEKIKIFDKIEDAAEFCNLGFESLTFYRDKKEYENKNGIFDHDIDLEPPRFIVHKAPLILKINLKEHGINQIINGAVSVNNIVIKEILTNTEYSLSGPERMIPEVNFDDYINEQSRNEPKSCNIF